MSSTDISAGSVWLQELFEQLEHSQAGVVCVTRESMTRGWMLFEAGALAKMIGTETQRVCPVLLDLDPGELQYPLAAFQWKFVKPDAEEASKAQVLSLVKMVNESIETPSKQLSEQRLLAQFTAFWPQFWKTYTDLRAQNNTVAIAPVQIGNNDILVEVRAGFRQMLNMLERGQRIEVAIECPSCGTVVDGEFFNSCGATRHLTCPTCHIRFIAHLDSNHCVQAKLLAAGAQGSPMLASVASPVGEKLAASCPSCGGSQEEAFSVVPGATRHLRCVHCNCPFVAHKMPDGKLISKLPSAGGLQPITPEEAFLRKTSFWVDPNKVSQLISRVCEADEALAQEAQTKTLFWLKKAVSGLRPQESSVVINVFLKVLLQGAAFKWAPDPFQSTSSRLYANRLEPKDVLRAYYRGQVKRLRNQFLDLGVKDFEAIGRVLQTSSVPGANDALLDALKAAADSEDSMQAVLRPLSPIAEIPKKEEHFLETPPLRADSVDEGQ